MTTISFPPEKRPKQLKPCPDCDGLCADEVMPGEHAPHHVSNSRGEISVVNCIGLPIRRSP